MKTHFKRMNQYKAQLPSSAFFPFGLKTILKRKGSHLIWVELPEKSVQFLFAEFSIEKNQWLTQ